jgi:hypothetical protein
MSTHPAGLERKSEQQWSTERHFYSMPATCEMFLAAVCAIQNYYKWLAKRFIKAEVIVHSPSSELDFLVPTIWLGGDVVVSDVVHDLNGLTLDGFDQTVKFDPDLAYRLSLKTEKHVVQVFGMMVGSDPPKVMPDVSCITDEIEPNCDIMLLPFPGSEQVYEFLVNNRPELNTCTATGDCARPVELGLQGRMLVGVRSGLTYLAAAAGRAVVEIYPTDCHRNWLSKWGAQHYQMIYGNPGDVQPDLVFRAIEAMWKKVEARRRAMQVGV